MSQMTSYIYDRAGYTVTHSYDDGRARMIASPNAKSGWEMEGATHIGECDAVQTLTVWLTVENGVITEAENVLERIQVHANVLCGEVRGKTIEEVKRMLDNQPAGQPKGRSIAAAAIAAALAAGL